MHPAAALHLEIFPRKVCRTNSESDSRTGSHEYGSFPKVVIQVDPRSLHDVHCTSRNLMRMSLWRRDTIANAAFPPPASGIRAPVASGMRGAPQRPRAACTGSPGESESDARTRHPDDRWPAAIPSFRLRSPRREAGPEDRHPQLWPRRRRHHAVVGHGAAGRRRGGPN